VALLFGRDVSAPGRLGSPTPLERPEADFDLSQASGTVDKTTR
jgi:hypothetical protein